MILRNSLTTPDGTEIRSMHRNDFQTHTDANGKVYMVDGGLDYFKRSVHKDQVDTSVTIDDPTDPEVRNHMVWGTRGKDGDQPLTYVLLRDMETSHIEAILHQYNNLNMFYRQAFQHELSQREDAATVLPVQATQGAEGLGLLSPVQGSLSEGV